MASEEVDYTVPLHVRKYLTSLGYELCDGVMTDLIEQWRDCYASRGEFYDYHDKDSMGHTLKVHRRSCKPAKRVCKEWAALMFSDPITVSCEDEACNAWLADYLERINFFGNGKQLVQDAFALGTGAWALWLDLTAQKMQVRRYKAKQVLPLTWDDDGVTECAFTSRVAIGGKVLDQVQLHVCEPDGYHIKTVLFDRKTKKRVSVDGVVDDLATGCETPTFALVKPAISNTFVDITPYGQSVFADSIDEVQAVDLCFDAIFNEVDLAKLRIFIDDMLIDVQDKDGNRQAIPFGKNDNTVYRKVSGVGDGQPIVPFAPQMRTEQQVSAYRLAIQKLGDDCGFGKKYFDIDAAGGMKTAHEVVSDNADLMRNIRSHERLMQGAIADICRALCHCATRFLGAGLGDPGTITVNWDDSVIVDTQAEKAQDQSELNVTLNPWEYRRKWYGESEEEAKANVPGAIAEDDYASFGEQ